MAKKASSKPTAEAPAPARFEGEIMALAAANYADDKKAEDIIILDTRGISPVTDFMVICTATSMPHLKAVRDEVDGMLFKEHGKKPIAKDLNLESLWLILHYGDVTVHIFHKDKRDFYSLEDLWSDSPRVPWEPIRPEPAKKVAKPAVAKKVTAKKATKKAATKKAASKKSAK